MTIRTLLLIALALSSVSAMGQNSNMSPQDMTNELVKKLEGVNKMTPEEAKGLSDTRSMVLRDAAEAYLMQDVNRELPNIVGYFLSLPTTDAKKAYLKEWEYKTFDSAEAISDVLKAAYDLSEAVKKAGVKVKDHRNFITKPVTQEYQTYVMQKAYETDKENGATLANTVKRAIATLDKNCNENQEGIREWQKNKAIYERLADLCPECATIKTN